MRTVRQLLDTKSAEIIAIGPDAPVYDGIRLMGERGVGALLVMPAKLGMPVLHLDTMAWQSLMGHMMFGAILGIVTGAWLRRASQTHA